MSDEGSWGTLHEMSVTAPFTVRGRSKCSPPSHLLHVVDRHDGVKGWERVLGCSAAVANEFLGKWTLRLRFACGRLVGEWSSGQHL